VPIEKAKEQIALRSGDLGYQSLNSNIFEKIDEIEMGESSGDVTVNIGEAGRRKVFSADTGSSASGGGDYHRLILQKSYRAFTKLGAITTLPAQEGESLPDGVADLPIDPLEDADSVEEANDLKEQLKEDYGRLYELSGGRDIAIEAETTTITKPMQTLSNLRKALEADKKCVFTCKDATFDDKDSRGFGYWPGRGEQIIYDYVHDTGTSSGTINYDTVLCAREQDRYGNCVFYNKSSKYRLDQDDSVFAVRPKADSSNELTWKETGDKTEVVVETDDGNKLARFATPKKVADPSPTNVYAYRERNENGNWVVREGVETSSGNWHKHDEALHGPYETVDDLNNEWQDIKNPFIPENEFPEMPTEEDFMFVVFPDSQNDDYDEPQIYEHGETRPLFDDQDVEIAIGSIAETDDSANQDQEQGQDKEQEHAQAETQPNQQGQDTTESTQESQDNAQTQGGEQESDDQTETDTDNSRYGSHIGTANSPTETATNGEQAEPTQSSAEQEATSEDHDEINQDRENGDDPDTDNNPENGTTGRSDADDFNKI